MHINRNRFHLIHYKSTLKLEKTLHTFRITMFNIEIFDLNNRIIDSLTKELSRTSKILYLVLYQLIYGITTLTIISFNNLYTKLFFSYKQKF